MKITRTLLATALLLSSSAFADNITTFSEDFSNSDALTNWDATSNAHVAISEGKLTSTGYGMLFLDKSGFTTGGHYDISMSVANDEPLTSWNSQGIVFGFTDRYSPFYSTIVKTGKWGMVLVYRHENYGAYPDLVYNSITEHGNYNVDPAAEHVLNVNVQGLDVDISFNGLLTHSMRIDNLSGENGVGVRLLPNASYADNIIVNNQQTFYTDFGNNANFLPSSFDMSGDWSPAHRALSNIEPGDMITNTNFVAEGDYSTSFIWKSFGSAADNSPSLMFNVSDDNSAYYTAFVEGDNDMPRLRLYKHTNIDDTVGMAVASADLPSYAGANENELSVQVQGKKVALFLNNEAQLSYTDVDGIVGGRSGMRGVAGHTNFQIKSFKMTR